MDSGTTPLMISNPKQWIRENQEAIMEHYLGIKIGPRLICSPFRSDNKPTCGFYYGSTGILYLHDFGTEEHLDVISIVRKKFTLTYNACLSKIIQDRQHYNHSEKKDLNENIELEYVAGSGDYSYFNRYGIKESTLRKYGVYTARALYKDGSLSWR